MTEPWRVVRRDMIVSNKWVVVERNDYQTGNQIISDYLIIRRQPFVLVIAETPGGVVLIRQYRPATERFYWSLPAGFIDPEEDVMAAAARELFEETGAAGRDFVRVGSLDPLPGYVSSTAHVVKCVVENPLELRPDYEEACQIVVEPWSRITALIAEGQIIEMQAVAALLLAHLAVK